MTDAPDRIWAWSWAGRPRLGQWTSTEEQAGECREYIRRDAVCYLPEVEALVYALEEIASYDQGPTAGVAFTAKTALAEYEAKKCP